LSAICRSGTPGFRYNEVTAKTLTSNNADNFLKFLKGLDRKHRHKKLHIIVDNLSVHEHKDVKRWLEGYLF
jgi:transposase